MQQIRKSLQWISVFSTLFAVIAFIAFATPLLQTKITLRFTSNASGWTQLFASAAGFAPQQSLLRPVHIGENSIDFVLPQLVSEVRWDPIDGPVAVDLQASLSFAGVEVPVTPQSVQPLRQIKDVRFANSATQIQTSADATDPSVTMRLPWRKLIAAKLVALALTAGLALLMLIWLRKMSSRGSLPTIRDPITVVVLFGTLLVLIGAAHLTGRIPVGNGEGWDGAIYMSQMVAVGQGDALTDDPYRMSRLGAFLPALLTAAHGFAHADVFRVVTVSSLCFAALSVALLFDALRQVGVGRRNALLSAATFLFSWPALVMPAFYPVLTDHAALAVSCLSLWLWSQGSTKMLYVVCAWSIWIMPGLFIVPLVLAALPLDEHQTRSDQGLLANFGLSARTTRRLFFAAISLALAGGPFAYMVGVSDAAITDYSSKLGIEPLLAWKLLALTLVMVLLIAISWFWADLAGSAALWKAVHWRKLMIAGAFTGIGFWSVATLIDWSSGFTGPTIVRNLFVSSLSTPLRSLVAHTLFFGPVFIFGILAAISALTRRTRQPWAPLCIIAAFLPALAVGPESRQWLPVFPVIIMVFASARQPMMLRIACLTAGIILFLPAIGMSEALEAAMRTRENFGSPDWQTYFGRYGPWMSVKTYYHGLLLTLSSGLFGAMIFLYERGRRAVADRRYEMSAEPEHV